MNYRFVLLATSTVFSVYATSPPPVFVVNFANSNVYSIVPQNGSSTLITPVAVGPTFGLNGIQQVSPGLAYTANFDNNNLYAVNLTTGVFTQVNNTPITLSASSGLEYFALASDSLAYAVNANEDTLFSID